MVYDLVICHSRPPEDYNTEVCCYFGQACFRRESGKQKLNLKIKIMKTKIICFTFSILIFISILSFAQQDDCPTLTISIGDKVVDSYENTINKNDIITISITNTKNRFKISKAKIKLIPPDNSGSEIKVKGFASKFSNNPVIEIPVNKIINEDFKIEKIVLSILEIIDESTNSTSDCFFYGQEYGFWVGD